MLHCPLPLGTVTSRLQEGLLGTSGGCWAKRELRAEPDMSGHVCVPATPPSQSSQVSDQLLRALSLKLKAGAEVAFSCRGWPAARGLGLGGMACLLC